jgi:hypothetical protein
MPLSIWRDRGCNILAAQEQNIIFTEITGIEPRLAELADKAVLPL